jgi:hypothetical protein
MVPPITQSPMVRAMVGVEMVAEAVEAAIDPFDVV